MFLRNNRTPQIGGCVEDVWLAVLRIDLASVLPYDDFTDTLQADGPLAASTTGYESASG